MTDDREDDAEDGFLEGTYTTDIGLTWLASHWIVLEHHYREYIKSRPDGGPVMVWLWIAEMSVDEFDRSKAVQLSQDVQRLLSSALDDETIRKVWVAATHGVFDPEEHGMSTSVWLRKAEGAWLARVRQDDPAFMPPPPQPVVDETLRQAVLGAMRPVAASLDLAAQTPALGKPVTGLIPALEQVVALACADLGYRFFLRAMKAYNVPVPKTSYDEFVALGERFGYPEWVVHEGLNDRTD
ncbi:hypothetical protein GT045_25635 [Streptomyces sp. SID486]|uniref:hypothetical protein n=1 Tax=Streptomyces sp. SID486 TaxID=2690264 RepID=UPI00136CB776|nr:hypothetical protein [Streptomyces sp. SID486]MYX98103.1 hypothetical protein [Streptomyces sp. SID486]